MQVKDKVRWLETVLNTDNVAVIRTFSEKLETDFSATIDVDDYQDYLDYRPAIYRTIPMEVHMAAHIEYVCETPKQTST